MQTTAKAIIFGLIGSAMTIGTALAQQQIRSADNDFITVRKSGDVTGGAVTLCLRTQPNMWKKDIRIGGVGTLASENGTQDCTQVNPGFIRFEMIKAKAFGVMTGVGYGSLDLSQDGGSRVTIFWQSD
ncbi:MAG: hypothetical protein AAGI92_12745 [Pseudomonadota bacterium]